MTRSPSEADTPADGIIVESVRPPREDDTGRLATNLLRSMSDPGIAPPGAGMSSTQTPEELAELFISKLTEKVGNGNGGPHDKKSLRKNTWIVSLLVMLFGSGGIITMIYVSDARSQSNEHHVEENKISIEDNTKAIGEIKDSVDDIGDKLDDQYDVQIKLVEGIDDLTKEAQTERQTRLEDEVKRLRRENRILERPPPR